ncbi:hypothetical protein [Nocardioides rubriscoriae]|uniref:hypothetical protein n=1 Tax=Nocardioides rubriscoriae TaxID=642762 RepID=UPI0011E06EA8|nr:hypothetical protein [Nocardioides rubriscoriae]
MSEPASGTGDPYAAEVAALRAERDDLEQRALEAEAMAEQLADALADAQRRLAERATAWHDAGQHDHHDHHDRRDSDDPRHLTLFDDATPESAGGPLAPDGSDQAVLPIALAATAVVAFLVSLVMIASGRFSFLTVLVLAVAGGLAWAAVQTRVTRRSVEVVDGIVRVVEGDTTRTFDLRNDGVRVDVQGTPGDAYWRVRFYRRALDPVDVDASMVDPADFMARLREVRPNL